MSVNLNAGSVVAQAGQQINVASLLNVVGGDNPTYLVVSLLDRDEYTASSNADTGALSGNGATADFANIGGDSNTVGIVFTYDVSTSQYTNATYGNLANLIYTASTNTNDNTSISFFTTNNSNVATQYANNPHALASYTSTSTNYVGSVSAVTEPNVAGAAPSEATPDFVAAAASSFVGQAWNMGGCWVLASDISAEAGASLPITSTSLGVAGMASGEWIVAYNGPAGQTGDWQSQITAGEMVVFETSANSGHITTVVSGSGSSASLIDNMTFVDQNGQIENSAYDGSSSDIVIANPHPANQEWAMAVPGSVVVYELDCPFIAVTTPTSTVAADGTEALAPLFNATNPVASQNVTEYQFYDTATGGAGAGSFIINNTDEVAGSAANPVTVSAAALSGTDFVAGNSGGTDTIDVRAFNGSYWGDWQTLTTDVEPPPAPTINSQITAQTWTIGQSVDCVIAANTFTAPQGEQLVYSATLANGSPLPSWLDFNPTTQTFTGQVPDGSKGLKIMVTAADSGGGSTSETFSVLTPAPPPPTATEHRIRETWQQGKLVDFSLAPDSFSDPQREALTYSARLADGAALPSWLQFDPQTMSFSGVVPTLTTDRRGRHGSKANSDRRFRIDVTATDSGGASASETIAVASPASASPKLMSNWVALAFSEGSSAVSLLTSPGGDAPSSVDLQLSETDIDPVTFAATKFAQEISAINWDGKLATTAMLTSSEDHSIHLAAPQH